MVHFISPRVHPLTLTHNSPTSFPSPLFIHQRYYCYSSFHIAISLFIHPYSSFFSATVGLGISNSEWDRIDKANAALMNYHQLQSSLSHTRCCKSGKSYREDILGMAVCVTQVTPLSAVMMICSLSLYPLSHSPPSFSSHYSPSNTQHRTR